MFRTVRRTAALMFVTTGVAVSAWAGVASAHIHTDPPAIEAGQQATVGFLVEHGCADANTTGLDIKLPEGVSNATAAEDGWQVAVTDGVVRFSGGNLDSHTPMTFRVTFTAPDGAGTAVFPTVQHCGDADTSWLDVQEEGQPEPEHPAPVVEVTQGPPTAADLAGAAEGDDGDEGDATGATERTTDGAATTASTVPAITLAPTVSAAPATSSDDDDGTAAGVIVGIVVGVAVVLAVAGTIVTLRRRRSGPSGPSGPGTPGGGAAGSSGTAGR